MKLKYRYKLALLNQQKKFNRWAQVKSEVSLEGLLREDLYIKSDDGQYTELIAKVIRV